MTLLFETLLVLFVFQILKQSVFLTYDLTAIWLCCWQRRVDSVGHFQEPCRLMSINLPTHAHEMLFHSLKSSLISFHSILCFSDYKLCSQGCVHEPHDLRHLPFAHRRVSIWSFAHSCTSARPKTRKKTSPARLMAAERKKIFLQPDSVSCRQETTGY